LAFPLWGGGLTTKGLWRTRWSIFKCSQVISRWKRQQANSTELANSLRDRNCHTSSKTSALMGSEFVGRSMPISDLGLAQMLEQLEFEQK
jgi:hypothetical protein